MEKTYWKIIVLILAILLFAFAINRVIGRQQTTYDIAYNNGLINGTLLGKQFMLNDLCDNGLITFNINGTLREYSWQQVCGREI